MLKNEFAIKDCGSLLIDLKTDSTGFAAIDGVGFASQDVKIKFLSLLMENGYSMTIENIALLLGSGVKTKDLELNLKAVLSVLGGDVNHYTLISTFPKIDHSHFVKVVTSFYNYLTGEGLRENFINVPYNENETYKLLDIKSSVDEEIKQLFLSTIPLKLDHEKLVSSLYESNDAILESIDVQNIVLKEILARHIKHSYLNGVNGIAKNSIDVLRAIALISGQENAKLDNKFKIASLSNSLRRLVIQDLNNVIKIEDVTGTHKEMFKHLFKSLHVNDKKYSAFNSNVSAIAKELYSVNNPKTSKSLIHSIVEYGVTTDEDLAVLTKNPSVFARSFDAILRKCTNELDEQRVFDAFSSIVKDVNSKVLLQMLGHFKNREHDMMTRAFNLKGVSGGVKIIENKPLLGIGWIKSVTIQRFLKDALIEKYKANGVYHKKIMIKDELWKINLPSNLSANDSAKSVARGSKLDIEFKDILRLFVHWKGHDDLDLSAIYVGDDNKVKSRCAFYETSNKYSVHSGDVRSAPNGGSEFIDIHMDKIPDDVRYIIMHVNTYSGRTSGDISELFAGFMHRENTSGYVYEPRTVEDKFTLTGDVSKCTPFFIDLKTKELVWLDDKGKGGNYEIAESLTEINRLLTIANKEYTTIGELLSLHAESIYSEKFYNHLTEEEKQDIIVFSKEFAFDVSNISANYI